MDIELSSLNLIVVLLSHTEGECFGKAKDLKLQTKKSAQNLNASKKHNLHPHVLPMHWKLPQTTNQLKQAVFRSLGML